jgi:uncharacterized protein (TIGR00106 family)
MSVLTELTIMPLGLGSSLSKQVSQVVDMIRSSGHPYKLNPMGTVFETSTVAEAHSIIEKACGLIDSSCQRIYIVTKMDINKNSASNLDRKLMSIESKIGKTDK